MDSTGWADRLGLKFSAVAGKSITWLGGCFTTTDRVSKFGTNIVKMVYIRYHQVYIYSDQTVTNLNS